MSYEFYNIETKQFGDFLWLCEQCPDAAFAYDVGHAILESYGFYRTRKTAQPAELGPWQSVREISPSFVAGHPVQRWEIYNTVNPQEYMRADIADHRFNIETGGIVIDGMPVPTDRNTQSILTSMNLRADRDPEYRVDFKISPGEYINLGRTEIVALGDAVYAHVQAAFAREKELNERIDAGEIITRADW